MNTIPTRGIDQAVDVTPAGRRELRKRGRVAEALCGRIDELEGTLRRIADSEDGYYMACSDTPFCRKGEPGEHSEDCAVRIIHDAVLVKP